MIEPESGGLPRPFLPSRRPPPLPHGEGNSWRMWLVRRTCRRSTLPRIMASTPPDTGRDRTRRPPGTLRAPCVGPDLPGRAVAEDLPRWRTMIRSERENTTSMSCSTTTKWWRPRARARGCFRGGGPAPRGSSPRGARRETAASGRGERHADFERRSPHGTARWRGFAPASRATFSRIAPFPVKLRSPRKGFGSGSTPFPSARGPGSARSAER